VSSSFVPTHSCKTSSSSPPHGFLNHAFI
jgi:hypothetical protein